MVMFSQINTLLVFLKFQESYDRVIIAIIIVYTTE